MAIVDPNISPSQSLYEQTVSSKHFKLAAAIALIAGIIIAGSSGAHGISQAAHIGLATGGTALIALGLVGLFMHWRQKSTQEFLESPLFKALQVDPSDAEGVAKAREWALKKPEEKRVIMEQQQRDMLDSLRVLDEVSD